MLPFLSNDSKKLRVNVAKVSQNEDYLARTALTMFYSSDVTMPGKKSGDQKLTFPQE